MGVCDTFNCATGIPNVVVPNCGDTNFGQAIVKIFLQRTDGNGFDDETDVVTEGTWNTKLAISPTGSTYYNRIVAIGDLHTGVKPATENETQQAPFGGDELVSRKHTVTFEIKRWNRALIDSINQLRCFSSYRAWLLTDKGYLLGGHEGYDNVSIQWGSQEFLGIGNGKTKSSNIMSWTSLDDSEPLLTTFLLTKQNP